MSSIIEGYEYDIFISYRQKDNKGDRWVSEFVEALKTEIESTFKEEISVYFDFNLHDGLLETHDVDASLRDKLKCLVFIPIISRTYCDPKSFAWEHEFKAFVEQASQDQLGLKVKLPSGNVACRVLPIRIHDLDTEDIRQCESVLGGVLRGLEFIYRSTGVNRPLRLKEDKPQDNLNKTIYRDQINKVALAIKEIILGLKIEPAKSMKFKPQRIEAFKEIYKEEKPETQEKSVKLNNRNFLLGIFIAAILLITALLVSPKIFKRDKFKDIRDPDGKISIAVMPFENLTGDVSLNWFRKGIASLIINGLGNSPELSVCDDHTMFEVIESMNKVNSAEFSPSMSGEVAYKARAETYISGSYHGKEGKYWILANLVSTQSGDIINTNKVEGDLRSSGYLVLADSLCNEIKNFLEIKALKEDTDFDFREAYPKSAEAYRYFIEGMNTILTQDYKSAIQSLKKALEIDSTFTLASFYVAYAYSYSGQDEQCVLWTKKTYKGRDRIPSKYQLLLEFWYAQMISKNLADINRNGNLLEESGINSRLLWFDIGNTYSTMLGQYKKAVEVFKKVMRISLERGSYWKYEPFYYRYGEALHKLEKHEEEKEMYRIGLSFFPSSYQLKYYHTICVLSLGDTAEANKNIMKLKTIALEKGFPEYEIEQNLGQIYLVTKNIHKAEVYFRNAYKLNPQNKRCIFWLAWLIIDNDININEGMELIHKALEMWPDAYDLLFVKGWGSYKQGKYIDALDLLEKSWDLYPFYSIELASCITEVKKTIANQK